jgi:hypothetical protein
VTTKADEVTKWQAERAKYPPEKKGTAKDHLFQGTGERQLVRA